MPEDYEKALTPSVVTLQSTLAATQAAIADMQAQKANAQIAAQKQQEAEAELRATTAEQTAVATRLKQNALDKESIDYERILSLQRSQGSDPADVSTYILNKLAATKRQATEDWMAASQELQRRQTVGLFEDPVEWIKAQLTIKGQKDLVDSLSQKALAADQQLTSAAAAVQAGAQLIIQANASKSDQQRADELRLSQLQGQIKLTELDIKNYASGIETAQKLSSMSTAQAHLYGQMQSEVNDARRLALQAASQALEERKFKFNQELKEREDKTSEAWVNLINKGAAALGDPNTYSWATLQAIRQSGKAGIERLEKYLESGINGETAAKQGNPNFRYIGNSAGDSAVVLDQLGTSGTPGSDRMRDLLRTTLATVKASLVATKEDKNPTAVISGVNAEIKKLHDSWQKNAEAPGSPVAVTNATALFAQLRKDSQYTDPLLTSPVYTKNLQTLAERNALGNLTADQLMKFVQEGVGKDYTQQQAAEYVQRFYAVGSAIIASNNNLDGYGIAPIKGYKAYIPGANRVVDMTNVTEISHAQLAVRRGARPFWGSDTLFR